MFNLEELYLECPFSTIDCNNISFGKLLGEGINACVYCIELNNQKYAAKVYKDMECYEDIKYELDVAKRLEDTKYSVHVHGVCYINHEHSIDILLIMEYLDSDGDLYDYIQNVAGWTPSYLINGKMYPPQKNDFIYYNPDDNIYWSYLLPEPEKIKITRSIIEGVQELHSKGIIHGDIKTNNMVLQYKSKEQTIKLIDFGVSYFSTTDECIDIYYKCGTVGYRAPEQDDYRMCYLSDIYSMGITIIELWNGDIWINKDDFKGCRSEALSGLRKIEKNHTQFGKLLRRAISLHPKKRITAVKFLQKFNEIFNNDHKYRKCPQDQMLE